MTVVGVLVDAEVGHHHDVVAEVGTQVTQCDLHDTVGVVRATPDGVLGLGHAEEDDRPHSEFGQFRNLVPQ